MEHELFAVCGGMLGAIEAIACELPEDGAPRLARSVADARELGLQMRDRLEALALLALPELREDLVCDPFSLTRWLDHALRGARHRVEARGVRLAAPDLTAARDVLVAIDVSRMDRALTAMCEHVGAAVPAGRVLAVTLDIGAESVAVTMAPMLRSRAELRGSADGMAAHPKAAGDDGTKPVAALLIRAWQMLLGAHGGACELDHRGPSLRIELPISQQPSPAAHR